MPFDDIAVPLLRCGQVSAATDLDAITTEAVGPFDFDWTGSTTFQPWAVPTQLPTDFGLGVIVGASGSGKSTLLRDLGPVVEEPAWEPGKSITAHFPTAEDATARFMAVGLSSVPVWCKPYHVLSNGERFRADLARVIATGAHVDEFSSVVDRSVAKAASMGLARYVRARDIRQLVLATCHRDVIAWLEPDWAIDTDAGELVLNPKEWVQREPVVVEVHQAARAAWDSFMRHHYLRDDIHKAARCFIATWDGVLVGFSSSLPFPHAVVKRAYREHRTVVLPEYQGLGIGVALSDHAAAIHVSEGKRYFSRTTHPRMGEHRERSEAWRPTDKNRKRRHSQGRNRADVSHWQADFNRVAYSHEYVGRPPDDPGRFTVT